VEIILDGREFQDVMGGKKEKATTKGNAMQWRTEGRFRGLNPLPPPKFQRPSKIMPNSTRL